VYCPATDQVSRLNQVGAVIWERLDTPCTLDDLANWCHTTFPDAPPSMPDEVKRLVAELVHCQLLERADH